MDDTKFLLDFIAFARSKGEEEYDYRLNGNCAMVQFLRETGRAKNPRCGPYYWREADNIAEEDQIYFARDIERALVSDPENFAALADRLSALLPSRLTAQGIDAPEGGETVGLDPKDESPVGAADAPKEPLP